MFNINNVFLVFLTVWAGIDLALGSRDINSGCPMWGCLPWGTFSLSAGIPETDGLVKWSAEVDHVADSSDVFNSRGCVSDQIAVVCATQSGYVSLDPASGKQFWNYTTTTSPYLPVMDIYGDVIGMDRNELLAIEQTGSVNRPINISVLQPAFSIMLANDSILLLTASRADANQIVTYSTDGIVSGAIALDGTVERVKGTFIPTSQPIIAGYRAYLIAQFMPHNLSTPEAQASLGMHRLYAFDLLNHMTERIKIAWYYNMERERPSGVTQALPHSQNRNNGKGRSVDALPPIVTYFRGTVYVNVPFWSSEQPYQGTFWAFWDEGDWPSLMFKSTAAYGQMAVYDTFDRPLPRGPIPDDHTIWTVIQSPPMITGYSAKNGSFLGSINLVDLVNVSIVTSQMAITRQPKSSKDVLVFGATDSAGSAFLVAMETDSFANARLLWKTKLSEEHQGSDVYNEVRGQIVNVAQTNLDVNGATDWHLGLVAMVLENGKGYSKLHVKGVF